jgi:hypothetical protein
MTVTITSEMVYAFLAGFWVCLIISAIASYRNPPCPGVRIGQQFTQGDTSFEVAALIGQDSQGDWVVATGEGDDRFSHLEEVFSDSNQTH